MLLGENRLWGGTARVQRSALYWVQFPPLFPCQKWITTTSQTPASVFGSVWSCSWRHNGMILSVALHLRGGPQARLLKSLVLTVHFHLQLLPLWASCVVCSPFLSPLLSFRASPRCSWVSIAHEVHLAWVKCLKAAPAARGGGWRCPWLLLVSVPVSCQRPFGKPQLMFVLFVL